MNTSPPLPLEMWERMPPEAWEKRLALEAEIEAKRLQVVQLAGIVQELQERLGHTSRNGVSAASVGVGADGGPRVQASVARVFTLTPVTI